MSQENVEIVRRGNEAFNRGDRDTLLADYHPDVEWRDLQHAPDTPESICGVPALRALIDQWDDAFEEFTAEVDEYIDAGDCVVAVSHWRAIGKGSGLAVDTHTADVFEFAGGQIVRVTVGYSGRDEALKAVGLEE